MIDEKRKEPRVQIDWPIRAFVDSSTIEGKTKDVSLHGICIQFNNPIHLEGETSISIFPPNCNPIDIIGKIVWSDLYALDMDNNNVPVCIGLSFVEISLKDRHILKEIIEIPVA
jgi:hypothetical protein